MEKALLVHLATSQKEKTEAEELITLIKSYVDKKFNLQLKGIARRFAPHRASTLWRELKLAVTPNGKTSVFPTPFLCNSFNFIIKNHCTNGSDF